MVTIIIYGLSYTMGINTRVYENPPFDPWSGFFFYTFLLKYAL